MLISSLGSPFGKSQAWTGMCHHPKSTKAMLDKSEQERSHQEPDSVDSGTSHNGGLYLPVLPLGIPVTVPAQVFKFEGPGLFGHQGVHRLHNRDYKRTKQGEILFGVPRQS